MTDEKALILKIHELPESLKAEVDRFVSMLSKASVTRVGNEKRPARRRRKAGSASGKYHMTADFDAPLDDLKEYM